MHRARSAFTMAVGGPIGQQGFASWLLQGSATKTKVSPPKHYFKCCYQFVYSTIQGQIYAR